MSQSGIISEEILHFISRRIDSVPHLEAVLLLWANPHQAWSEEDVSARIYVSRDRAKSILSELVRDGLIIKDEESPSKYKFDSTWDEGKIMPRISEAYQRHLVYVASLIHSKSSSEAVKQFAKAFQLSKKE